MNKSRYMSMALAAVLVSACLGAFAYAAVNNHTAEVIYACANKTNGQMRLAAGPQNCKNHEVALSWNQEGPQGPPGTPATPSDDFQVFTNTGAFADVGQQSLSAACEDGLLVIGWLPPQSNVPGVDFDNAFTSIDGTAVTWTFDSTSAGGPFTVTVGVVCMRVPEE